MTYDEEQLLARVLAVKDKLTVSELDLLDCVCDQEKRWMEQFFLTSGQWDVLKKMASRVFDADKEKQDGQR